MSPDDRCPWCGHALTISSPEFGLVLVGCEFCGWSDEVDEDDIS